MLYHTTYINLPYKPTSTQYVLEAIIHYIIAIYKDLLPHNHLQRISAQFTKIYHNLPNHSNLRRNPAHSTFTRNPCTTYIYEDLPSHHRLPRFTKNSTVYEDLRNFYEEFLRIFLRNFYEKFLRRIYKPTTASSFITLKGRESSGLQASGLKAIGLQGSLRLKSFQHLKC